MPDAVPAPVQPLLELFAAELKSVKFPDVDAKSLDELVARARDAADAVAKAEAALDAARAVLADRQDALTQKAQRALAYAKVYAEDQPELLERLDAIALPRPRNRPRSDEPSATTPRRRRKNADPTTPMFEAEPGALGAGSDLG